MIVGLLGLAGVGKDTVADFMVKNHGFVKVAIADPLKRICKDVFDFSDEQLWGPSEMRNAPDPRYVRMAKGALGTTITDWNEELQTMNTKPSPEEDIYLTPRYALQQLGSEWGRSCHKDIWGTYCLRVAQKILYQSGILRSVHYHYDQKEGLIVTNVPLGEKPKGVVISDVRFVNEVNNIQKAGGKVVKIVRPKAGLTGEAGQHISETEQAEIPDEVFDHHLINKANDLSLLEAAVAGLVEALQQAN